MPRSPRPRNWLSRRRERTPGAAEILNRVITTGLIEKRPSVVKRQCAAIRRVIRRLEAE